MPRSKSKSKSKSKDQSKHAQYREFWIKDTKCNRRKVDRFYAMTRDDFTHMKEATVQQCKLIHNAIMNKHYSQERRIINVLRLVVMGVYDYRLMPIMRDRLLEWCQGGLTEAYLTFGRLFPNMCTREIQPYFNFYGKNGASTVYTDDHWYDLLDDRDFGPLTSKVYLMSGFNRMWRRER